MNLHRATKGEVSYGVMRDDDSRVFFTTVERFPIPAGAYTVVWTNHPEHGYCYEVQNVPGRSGILIHTGNLPSASLGCIVIGRGFDEINKIPVVTNSLDALARLYRFMNKATFKLSIHDPD